MLVLIIMRVLRVYMFVMMIIIMGDMIRLAFQYNLCVDAADAAPLVPAELQFPAFNAKLIQFPDQIIGINPQIHQCAQCHITGNSGGTFKM
ncbi:hypothetical protein FACS189498_4620 [Spirochaetia bacterium]|nr:hypothetical protein FACS189498_4620 [Spirochaetia bacterium]